MNSRLPSHRSTLWSVFSAIEKAIEGRRGIVLPLLISMTLLTMASVSHSAAAQSSEWIWMGGSNSVGSSGLGLAGVYGTQGVASAENNPGSREGAATWTDSSGHLWLFGGLGFDSTGAQGYLNDLWEFDPATLAWTWVDGTSTLGDYSMQAGVYGTRGKAAAANIPGARLAAVAWTDKSGNLWLFGGDGLDSTGLEGELNDLWEFSPTTREWTWMAGPSTVACYLCGQAGAYGVMGHAAAGNLPGGRDSAVAWTDQSGNLWLFGGNGYDATDDLALLNDLWEFNPSTSQWTWVSGSSAGGQTGVYGTLGDTASTSLPGGRETASGWIDKNGNLWLFGGLGFNSASQAGELNDLWEFAPATGEWTWMAGSSLLNQVGVYGTKGTGAAKNTPSSRNAAASWTDPKGVLWLFGGNGYGSTGGDLDDLWAFNPSTGLWTWEAGVSANNQPGIYGALNTLAAGNLPGSREAMALWNDNKGNAWLFGGLGYDATSEIGYLNDLWEYRAPVPAATPMFNPDGGAFLSAQSVTLSDSTTGAVIYYTTDNSTPTTSSTKYTGPIAVNSTETLQAIAAAPLYLNSAVATAVFKILTAPPVITPALGNYTEAQSVTITDVTPGAVIYYTTNGTTPSAASTKYTTAISVTDNETIEAIAIAPGDSLSTVVKATFTIATATPVIKPALGNYTAAQSVTITDTTPGAVIYYTTNGTTPSAASTKYAAAISVTDDETVEAIAIAPNYNPSAVASATFTIPAAQPVFTPAGGQYASTQSVTISDVTPGAVIHYTTDGTTPSATSTKYTVAISVTADETIEAIAIAPNYAPSAVVKAKYTIGTVATPVFSLKAGPYSSPQSLTITDATQGATIYYTTNGTTPTTSSTPYMGAIPITQDETVEAIATAAGLSPSAVTIAAYTISAAEPAVVSQNITIGEATTGATVYYTKDGTTPTTASTKYTGPVMISGSEVLKFIAITPGYTNSPVRTVTVTVQ
jgi:N-acetylneuraminic acid mutarotase